MPDVPCQHLQIEALRQQLARWEGTAWRQGARCSGSLEDPSSLDRLPTLSSGCPAIDGALPEKGFRAGTLVEWLFSGEGDGTATLAFRAAAEALRAATRTGRGGAVVVLDRTGEFYPLAAVAQGIEPARMIVVHPDSQADQTWALDQALRCSAVAAAVAWPESAAGKLDGRTFRRLQLAIEHGGGLGLLIRPESVRGQPSWADVRLLVESLPGKSPYGRPRRMRVVLLRCRGGRGEQTVEVEIDDETHPLPED
jgi:protein ImuA